MTGTGRLAEPLEGADLALAAGELFALFVDDLVIAGKTVLEAEIGISIFPHVNGQISIRSILVFDQDGFAIAGGKAEEACPNTVAAIRPFKRGNPFGGDGKFPKNVDHEISVPGMGIRRTDAGRFPQLFAGA